MTRHPTVGIDDDFSAGQTAVAGRTTDDELAGRVDPASGAFMEPLTRQYLPDNLVLDKVFDLRRADTFIVLG